MHITPDPPTLPGADWAGLIDPETTGCYRSHGVTIDADWIAVGDDRYPIREVRHLHAVHERCGGVERGATAAAVSVAIAVAWVHAQLDAAGWVGALAALAAPLVLAGACAAGRWRRSAVLADQEGGPTLIKAELPRRAADRLVRAGYLAQQAAQLP